MRHIEFKAKRDDTKEWVFGDIITDIADGEKCFWIMPLGDGYDITEHGYRVITETVCQFTGLYDKNKVKIWEHDIVLYYGWVCKVVYGVNGACFSIIRVDNNVTELQVLNDLASSQYIEVIGNIYNEETK